MSKSYRIHHQLKTLKEYKVEGPKHFLKIPEKHISNSLINLDVLSESNEILKKDVKENMKDDVKEDVKNDMRNSESGESEEDVNPSKIKENTPHDKLKQDNYIWRWPIKGMQKITTLENADPRPEGRSSYWTLDLGIKSEPFDSKPKLKPLLTKSRKKPSQPTIDKEIRSFGYPLITKFNKFKPSKVTTPMSKPNVQFKECGEKMCKEAIFKDDASDEFESAEEYSDITADEFNLTSKEWDEICEFRYIPEELIEKVISVPVLKRWVGGHHILRVPKKTPKSRNISNLDFKKHVNIQDYNGYTYENVTRSKNILNSQKCNQLYSDFSNEKSFHAYQL